MDAAGTVNLFETSGVTGRDSSLTGGPARECALRKLAECGLGVHGFCGTK